MAEKQKAKRVLKNITFDHDNAHLALCSKDQGAANNHNNALIFKSANFSPETIEKASKIQVTMDIREFLERFFNIWGSDAEVLARLMGYEPEESEDEWNYEDWIEEKVQSFQILKSLHETESFADSFSKLTENDYLDVLNDQVMIEKALKELAEGSADPKVDASTKVEKQVEAPASKVNKKKEKQMTQATQEMVEKSALTAVEKALADQKVELEKALKQVADFQEAQKQAVIKSKTDAVKAVFKDEKEAETVLKAVLALEKQEDIDSLLAVFKAKNELFEKSDAFRELGASGSADEDKSKKNGVLEIIKAQNQKK